jgi:hypothetical protein
MVINREKNMPWKFREGGEQILSQGDKIRKDGCGTWH